MQWCCSIDSVGILVGTQLDQRRDHIRMPTVYRHVKRRRSVMGPRVHIRAELRQRARRLQLALV